MASEKGEQVMRFIRRTVLTAFMVLLSASVFCALPTLTFNSGTGSDTQASGSNGGTALHGTAAATAASTVVTLLVDNPDFTGVATDGTAVLWVLSSSGIQFSKITGYDNCAGVKTVTVATAYANTESGKTWGINGKRATLDNTNSRKLFTADILAGWTVSIEDNQTVTTSNIAVGASGSASGPITVQGSSSFITINQTANAAIFAMGAQTEWIFKNLKFTNSNGTKTSARGIAMNGSGRCTALHCVFGDATNTLFNGIGATSGNPILVVEDCAFVSTTGIGVGMPNGTPFVYASYFKSCGAGGFSCTLGGAVKGCVFQSITGDGIVMDTAGGSNFTVEDNTVHGCSGDGIDISAGVMRNIRIKNNQLTGNANYGIRAASGQNLFESSIDYNNFGTGSLANTSGAQLNVDSGAHDQAVDPGYQNASGGNFAIGAPSRAAAFPLAAVGYVGANQSTTYSYKDIGAVQSAGSDNGSVY